MQLGTPESLDFTSGLAPWRVAARGKGSVRIEKVGSSQQVFVAAGSEGKVEIESIVDASPFGGRRVEFSIRAKVDNASEEGGLQIREIALSPGRNANFWDERTAHEARVAGWQEVTVALDVPRDAVVLLLKLEVSAPAVVELRNPQLRSTPSLESQPRPIGAVEASRLRSLGILIGYLRFFHPSDQSASLDWRVYEVEAVRRTLAAHDQRELRDVFSWFVSVAAPTALLYGKSETVPRVLPPRGSGGALTRWVHIGFDDGGGEPYAGFRDGIGEPEYVGAVVRKRIVGASARACKHAVVEGRWTVLAGSIKPILVVRNLRDDPPKDATSTTRRLEVQMPEQSPAIDFGFGVSGHGVVAIEEVTLTCDGHIVDRIAPGLGLPSTGVGSSLYAVDWESTCDGRQCIRVDRRLDTTWDETRDVIDVDLGNDVRLRMPTAVWTDGNVTFPVTSRAPTPSASTPAELAARIAAVLDIWITLRWFVPTFEDLSIRWDDELTPSLRGAAQAGTADQMLEVVQRMVAGLRDDHANAKRQDFANGALPFFLRRIDGDVYVIHGMGPDRDVLPAGSKVLSIDGLAIHDAVIAALSRTSAATPGWGDSMLAVMLGYGREGEMVRLVALQPDGVRKEVTVMRISMAEFRAEARDRPLVDGTEVAPGVIYVDLDHLDLTGWAALADKVGAAKTIIFDLRGYINAAGFRLVQQLAQSEVTGPEWQVPVIQPDGTRRFERSSDSMFPVGPHIAARAIFLVNGHSASAVETVLQFVRSGNLGIMVGEGTGGTNGSPASIESVGFRVRFTAIRALKADGTPVQGHGFIPDVVVHPTLEGAIAGRDEILDAAVEFATRQ